MHRCLSIPEIIWLICEEVDAENQEERSKCAVRRAQLFALALTCRDFRQPALACLWEEICDLVPIVKCVGKDMWVAKFRGATDVPKNIQFSRPLSPADIATITKYGRLVRRFSFPDFDRMGCVNLSVYDALQHAFNDTTLFPNIRTLTIVDKYIEDHIGLFATQSLTCALLSSIVLADGPDYPALCPNVTSLNLKLWTYEEIEAALSSHWSNLSRFRVNAITYEVLHLLSQHSASLRVLKFQGIRTSDSYWLEPTKGKNALVFPELEEVCFCFDNTPEAAQFFSCLAANNRLSTLEIVLDYKESKEEEDWLEVLGSITKYSRCLKHLYIGDFVEDVMDDDYPITTCVLPAAQILTVIAANFTRLTYLKLTKAGGFALTDENVRVLTEALPLLGEFHLIGGCYPPRIAHDTTIASLIFFAQNCPMLSDLSFEFDARKDKLPQTATYLARGYKLRRVCVQVSPMDCPELVASILFALFPNLENVVSACFIHEAADSGEIEDGIYFKPWEIVHRLLEMDKEKRLGRVINSTIKVCHKREGE